MRKIAKPVRGRRKFILTVGEDGGILVYMEGKRILRRMFASSPEPGDVKHFESLLGNDPKAPIAIMVDTTDQTYVQQTLPPVSPLGLNKLIDRRLERDFAANDIKGAVKLGRSTEGRKEWQYLFISVANQPPLSQWIDFVIEQDNPCQGIYLLPVESEWLINKLSRRQTGKTSGLKLNITLKKSSLTQENQPANKAKHNWVILVSHNKVGGFRQVVTRDGKMVFTRLSQPVGEPSPGVIAGNIEQEISGTIEYLKRLSYNQDDHLEIIVIVAHEIRQHLSLENNDSRQISVRTPHEVSEDIGLIKATEEGDHFGDVIFASSFGINNKPRHRFSVAELDRIIQLQMFNKGADVLAGILVPAIMLMTLWSGWQIFTNMRNISFTDDKRHTAQTQIDALEQSKKELPPNIGEIIDSAQINGVIGKGVYSPMKMIAGFSKLLDDKTLVKSIEWTAASSYPESRRALNPSDVGKPGMPMPIEGNFSVEFLDNSGDADEFMARVNKFSERAKASFSDYNVSFSDIPGITGRNQAVEVNFGQDKNPQPTQQVSKDITVRYTVAGPKLENKDVQKGREQ